MGGAVTECRLFDRFYVSTFHRCDVLMPDFALLSVALALALLFSDLGWWRLLFVPLGVAFPIGLNLGIQAAMLWWGMRRTGLEPSSVARELLELERRRLLRPPLDADDRRACEALCGPLS